MTGRGSFAFACPGDIGEGNTYKVWGPGNDMTRHDGRMLTNGETAVIVVTRISRAAGHSHKDIKGASQAQLAI